MSIASEIEALESNLNDINDTLVSIGSEPSTQGLSGVSAKIANLSYTPKYGAVECWSQKSIELEFNATHAVATFDEEKFWEYWEEQGVDVDSVIEKSNEAFKASRSTSRTNWYCTGSLLGSPQTMTEEELREIGIDITESTPQAWSESSVTARTIITPVKTSATVVSELTSSIDSYDNTGIRLVTKDGSVFKSRVKGFIGGSDISEIKAGRFTSTYANLEYADFSRCSKLSKVGERFMSGVPDISGKLDIVFPNNALQIGNWFCSDRGGAVNIKWPYKPVSIGESFMQNRFEEGKSWDVYLPPKVSSIGKNFFKNCDNMTSTLFVGDNNADIIQNMTGAFIAYKGTSSKSYEEGIKISGSATMSWLELAGNHVDFNLIQDNESLFNPDKVFLTDGSEFFLETNLTDINVFCNDSSSRDIHVWASEAEPKEYVFRADQVLGIGLQGYDSLGSSSISVGNNFLANFPNLQYVALPKRLTSVGDNFLKNCSNFNMKLDLSYITSLGDSVLENCTAFNSEIILNPNLQSLGNNFMKSCPSFSVGIVIPQGVTTVGDNFLYGSPKCTKVLGTGNITTTGNNFLAGCSALHYGQFDIPKKLISVGDNFLKDCMIFTKKISGNSLTLDLTEAVSIGTDFLTIYQGSNTSDYDLGYTANYEIYVGNKSASIIESSDYSFAIYGYNIHGVPLFTFHGASSAEWATKFPNSSSQPQRNVRYVE